MGAYFIMERVEKKIFAALFFSLFASVTGVGIVVPLLPVYAHHLGATGFYIALIFGGFSLTRTFFLPWFGRLSDRKGRKPFIACGLFAYFVISVGFMFFQDIHGLVLLRMIQGVASAMIMPVAQAYIGDITPKGKEGLSMGIFNVSVFMGLSIGPLLGGIINDSFCLEAAFGAMAVMSFAAFCFSFFLLPPVREEEISHRFYPPPRWRLLLSHRQIISVSAFRFVYTTCIGIIWGFLPVYGDMKFSLSSSAIGVLVVLAVSVSGLLNIPMGAVADRMDKRILVITGGVLTAVAILLLGNAAGFWGMFVANVIFGIGGGISMPALMALAVVSGNETRAMGSVMSLITVAHSLGMLFGSILAGMVMDFFELQYAFFIGAAVMAAGIVIFAGGMYFGKPSRPTEPL